MKITKKIAVLTIFIILFAGTLAAAPAKKAANGGQDIPTDKIYSFVEDIYNLPIKPFAITAVNANDLLSADPQVLKLYEDAVNAEKQPNVFKNPNTAIRLWQEITKITANNPFMKIANKRLSEWRICINLYEKRQVSIDRLKILLASSALPSNQKVNITAKHLSEFGLAFGTQKILNLIKIAEDTEAIQENPAFKAKIKEIKQKRCNIGSGKDCYDSGRDFAKNDQEKMNFFKKACDLNYQPACNEQPAAPEPQPVAAAVPEPTDEPAEPAREQKTYTLKEDPVNLINQPPEVNGGDLLNADPDVIKLFEDASAAEKQSETKRNPHLAVAAWEKVAQAGGNNPFAETAKQRISDWNDAIAKLDKHESDKQQLDKNIADSGDTAQKVPAAVSYLDENGLVFGTLEVLDALADSEEAKNDETLKTKIKEIRSRRCELQSGADCRLYAENNAADEAEKAAYLKKACDLGIQESCENKTAATEAALEEVVAEGENQNYNPAENDKYMEELNAAGRRTRLILASSAVAAGAVFAVLGGISFWGMSKNDKDRKNYYNEYWSLGDPESQDVLDEFSELERKAKKADKKRKTFAVLGGVGVGLGAALIATGTSLFLIEFDGEKEVKKKYNVSFGASPLDQSVFLTLNW